MRILSPSPASTRPKVPVQLVRTLSVPPRRDQILPYSQHHLKCSLQNPRKTPDSSAQHFTASLVVPAVGCAPPQGSKIHPTFPTPMSLEFSLEAFPKIKKKLTARGVFGTIRAWMHVPAYVHKSIHRRCTYRV